MNSTTLPRSGSQATILPPARRGVPAWPVAVAFLLLSYLAVGTLADAIRTDSNLWIENVTFEKFEGSKLYYLVGSNPQDKPLADIQGIKMAAYPQLEQAENAIKAMDDKAALTHFKAARARAKEKWLQLWLDGKLYLLMEKQPGEAAAAMQAYINLIESKAPPKLYSQPPEIAARNLSKEDRARFNEKLQQLLKNATGEQAKQLKEMVSLTDPKDEPVRPADPANPAATPPSAIAMPAILLENRADAVVRHLSRGKFAEALEEVETEMKSATGGRTAVLLYERGLARLYLADEMAKDRSKTKEAEDRYKDAGLDFMRVVIYFRNSPYVGPCLLEAAYVHAKIQRPDVAQTLLDRAGSMIDPDDKPLMQRMDKLREQLAGGSAGGQ